MSLIADPQKLSMQAPKTSKSPKFILISGGDISGVDNGRIPASLGLLFQANGFKVTAIKVDSCYNCSSENLNQSLYGERYVLENGVVGSVDFGYFERLFDQPISGDNFITKGKILKIIEGKEEIYNNSKTLPEKNIDEIFNLINDVSQQPIIGTKVTPDLCIIVIGDILGDKEFQQALTEIKYNGNPFYHIHLSKLLDGKLCHLEKYMQKLRDQDFKPDMIIFRSNDPISDEFKGENIEYKLLKADIGDIINLPEVQNIKEIPIKLQDQNVYDLMAEKLELENGPNFVAKLTEWRDAVKRENSYKNVIKIAIVANYFIDPDDANGFMKEKIKESFETKIQQLEIAGSEIQCKVDKAVSLSAQKILIIYFFLFVWTQNLENDDKKENLSWKLLKEANGILIPAMKKEEGFNGLLEACKYARENNKPCLSLSFGFQGVVIEFALNEVGIIDTWPYNKILHERLENGIARKGKREIQFLTHSKLNEVYGGYTFIYERSCNRTEVKPDIIPSIVQKGLQFVAIGFDEDGKGGDLPSTQQLKNIARLQIELKEEKYNECITKLCHTSITTGEPLRMQIVELKNHPFYIGIHYHPKYGAHPSLPSPPFIGFLLAARRHQT